MNDEKFLKAFKMFDDFGAKSCDNKTALELLKQFHDTKWKTLVDFFPAINNGMMVIGFDDMDHNVCVSYYKQVAKAADYKALCHAFIYGVLHNKPEYEYALLAYLYLMHLEMHKYNFVNGKCNVCHMFDVKKMTKQQEFIEANNIMYDLCVKGKVNELDFNSATLILKYFRTLKEVVVDKSDYDRFIKALNLIKDNDNMKPSDYVNVLYSEHCFEGSKDALTNVVNILGYLNILHHPDVLEEEEMKSQYGFDQNSEFKYPVQLWNSSYGYDKKRVKELFGDMFK